MEERKKGRQKEREGGKEGGREKRWKGNTLAMCARMGEGYKRIKIKSFASYRGEFK